MNLRNDSTHNWTALVLVAIVLLLLAVVAGSFEPVMNGGPAGY